MALSQSIVKKASILDRIRHRRHAYDKKCLVDHTIKTHKKQY